MRMTIKDLGYTPGKLAAGPKNSILDVKGVSVGQVTVGKDGDDTCKGVTIIMPRHPDDITIPCYASIYTLNGNGEVTGTHQISDWGYINSPLAITNSCSLGIVYHNIWQWVLQRARDKGQSSDDLGHNYATPVVGETADWWLNDIHDSALDSADIKQALANALTQEEVQEGQYGGGAGMTCHMFPGGTGTSSRIVETGSDKKYTVGVIVQSNYGHHQDLQIAGVPIGRILIKEGLANDFTGKRAPKGKTDDGSIVIYLITDAPMLPHQLNRLARHCSVGLGQVGGHGIGRNFSGDIILALSTANRPDEIPKGPQIALGIPLVEVNDIQIIRNESIDTMFRAASEATEEAILNSMIAGRDGRTGFEGNYLAGFPVQRVKELLEKHRVVV